MPNADSVMLISPETKSRFREIPPVLIPCYKQLLSCSNGMADLNDSNSGGGDDDGQYNNVHWLRSQLEKIKIRQVIMNKLVLIYMPVFFFNSLTVLIIDLTLLGTCPVKPRSKLS